MRRRFTTALEALALLLVIAGLAWGGLVVRAKTWTLTEPLRYEADMENAWNWGARAAAEGYVPLYDRVVAETDGKDYGLDYLPGRLAVMTLWARHDLRATPPPTQWQRDHLFNRPLLRLNTLCEAVAALGIFAVAWDWSRRAPRISRRPLFGCWWALLAAAIAWLNPAALISAHGRPTWDVWVLPFYVWAVWCAGRRAWLTAGVILGVGFMFKGQVLFGVPFLLLWPLVRLRLFAAGRLLIGFAIAVSLAAYPWLVGGSGWAAVFVAAATVLPVALWAAIKTTPPFGRPMPARWLQWLMPLTTAAAIAACVPCFGGSINWLGIGLFYGATKFDGLDVGGSDSLAAILKDLYHWRPDDLVAPLQRVHAGTTISHVMIALYGVGVLGAAWAASRYERRGDRRFVLAMAAPWILYFAVFPKMHERYLLWGAAMACAGLIVNWGVLWLALFFCLASTSMSYLQMSGGGKGVAFLADWSPDAGRTLRRIVQPTRPGLAWAVLLATAVWMWLTVAGTFARRPRLAVGRIGVGRVLTRRRSRATGSERRVETRPTRTAETPGDAPAPPAPGPVFAPSPAFSKMPGSPRGEPLMARTPFIAGNWKMNTTKADAVALATAVVAGASGSADVGIAPPFVYLDAVAQAVAGSKVKVGAQDVYFEKSGAFTGEISVAMLKDVGVTFVLTGHSERRHVLMETPELVAKKAAAVLDAGLILVHCIGEKLEERDAGTTFTVCQAQLDELPATIAHPANLVIAYEPVWAIGTGRTATDQQAQDVHCHIRGVLATKYGQDFADAVRIQYGGSMKPDNAAGLLGQADVDGGLIGGAALKADSFLGIVAAAN